MLPIIIYLDLCYVIFCWLLCVFLKIFLLFITFGYHVDMGVERGVRLEGLSEAQISKALEDLVKVGASLKAW